MNLLYRLCIFLFAISTVAFIQSCGDDTKKGKAVTTIMPTTTKTVKIPAFNGDSAYLYVEKQVNFGFRIPGTEASIETREWIKKKLENYGLDVKFQPFTANIYNGEKWESANIIAKYNPSKKRRIILAAHYDTRFIAEKDPDPNKQNKPILGADDGGSGVGILLEMARLLHEHPIDQGIDFIFFDAEDNGSENDDMTWCLGAQHWATKASKAGYKAEFGILLDLVGAKGARYPKEYHSARFAPELQQKVWNLGLQMGYGDLFENQFRGAVNDDHYHVSRITGIPMIDIISLPTASGGFADHHHTHRDNMDIIDKNVLRKTGQVVTATVYKHSSGKL